MSESCMKREERRMSRSGAIITLDAFLASVLVLTSFFLIAVAQEAAVWRAGAGGAAEAKVIAASDYIVKEAGVGQDLFSARHTGLIWRGLLVWMLMDWEGLLA